MALKSLQLENSRDGQGAWKDRALDGLLMIHASAMHLWLPTGRIHKLRDLDMRIQGSQNSPTSGVVNAK